MDTMRLWPAAVMAAMVIASAAVAGDSKVNAPWYTGDVEYGLCDSCFEVDKLEVDGWLLPSVAYADDTQQSGGEQTDESSASSGSKKQTNQKKRKKPYVAPNWVAGDQSLGTWIATGVMGGAWIYLAVDGSDEDNYEQARDVGDYTQFVPGAAALGMTLGAKDYTGLRRFLIAGGATFGTVHILKDVNDKYRPDATDTKSYPSGHTAASFMGAGFIQQRYGPKWGVPSIVMASYTAWSRVAGQKHFTDDVISGASIAMFYNWLLVRPADADRAERAADLTRKRKFRFEWETSEGNVQKNIVQAPQDTGTPIDFQLDEVADPTVTASVAFDFRMKKRQYIRFRYTPFEIRDVGTLQQDTLFGGRVFAAGQDVYGIYFLGDLRGRFVYELVNPESRFSAQIGGGATLIDTDIELSEAMIDDGLEIDPDTTTRVRALGVIPIVYARLGVDFWKDKLELYAEGDFFTSSEEQFLDVATKLVYYFNPKWEISLGYRWVDDELEIEDLRNDFERSGALFHVAYSF